MPSLRISRYTVQGAPSALALPLAADLVRLWRLPVDPSRSLDIRQQRRIALLPRTAAQRIARTCRMPSVRRRSDLRDPAHRLDAVLDSVPVQESLGDLSRRSGSARGEERAGKLLDLVGPAPFLQLALQFLVPRGLRPVPAFACAAVDIVLL